MYKYKPRLAGTCVFTYAILERDTERQRNAVSIMPRLATPASLTQLLRSAAHQNLALAQFLWAYSFN